MNAEDLESLRHDLDDANGDIGRHLQVLDRLVVERRLGKVVVELERELGRRLLGMGESLLAYDAVSGALRCLRERPKDPILRQLRALALARIGETQRACRELRALVTEPQDDPFLIDETLGGLARTYKDLGFQHADRHPTFARRYWRRALRHYLRAYRKTGSPYTGINAATLAQLLDQTEEARSLATAIFQHCRKRWDLTAQTPVIAGQDDCYWLAATLGEAALLIGQIADARRWYREANRIGRQNRRFGDMGSTRGQLSKILLPKLKLDPTIAEDLFSMPHLAVFVGHMIDRPGRSHPRFPPVPALEEQLKAAICNWLDEHDVLVGYASAACGSDILFLEAIQERNGDTHVVLPYNRELFEKDSVEIIPGSSWGQRFEQVLSHSLVHTVCNHRLELGGVNYEYANRFLHGLAITRAAQLGTLVDHLAVWDKKPGDGPGGTADTVNRWREQGHDATIIDVMESLSHHAPPAVAAKPEMPALSIAKQGVLRGSDLVALFFADVKGYSRLTEPDLPRFVELFLDLIAQEIDALPAGDQPLKRNTWGDAIYLVLPRVDVAGRLALEINDRIRSTSWVSLGFPSDLRLRIGLHAGPTYKCTDPITKRDRYLGTHISTAARIEPIVSPGRVFASQAFACLAAEARVTDFVCRYIGLKALPKNAGAIPIFRVDRPRVPRTGTF